MNEWVFEMERGKVHLIIMRPFISSSFREQHHHLNLHPMNPLLIHYCRTHRRRLRHFLFWKREKFELLLFLFIFYQSISSRIIFEMWASLTCIWIEIIVGRFIGIAAIIIIWVTCLSFRLYTSQVSVRFTFVIWIAKVFVVSSLVLEYSTNYRSLSLNSKPMIS